MTHRVGASGRPSGFDVVTAPVRCEEPRWHARLDSGIDRRSCCLGRGSAHDNLAAQPSHCRPRDIERQSATPIDIARHELAQRQGSFSFQALDRLEDRGFIRRERDHTDRRKVIVTADSDGLARVGRMFDAHERTLAERFLAAAVIADRFVPVEQAVRNRSVR
jgi:hypothetical protein